MYIHDAWVLMVDATSPAYAHTGTACTVSCIVPKSAARHASMVTFGMLGAWHQDTGEVDRRTGWGCAPPPPSVPSARQSHITRVTDTQALHVLGGYAGLLRLFESGRVGTWNAASP